MLHFLWWNCKRRKRETLFFFLFIFYSFTPLSLTFYPCMMYVYINVCFIFLSLFFCYYCNTECVLCRVVNVISYGPIELSNSTLHYYYNTIISVKTKNLYYSTTPNYLPTCQPVHQHLSSGCSSSRKDGQSMCTLSMWTQLEMYRCWWWFACMLLFARLSGTAT